MRILFYGTPDYALPFLEFLEREGHEIVGTVTRPDRPAGRGLRPAPTPVKLWSQRRGIPVFQPESLCELEGDFSRLSPDLAVLVAYGRILPGKILEVPRLGNLNVHFSLLPEYRGAAPVQWALLEGKAQTGVTCFWMEEQMDAGPVFLKYEVPIEREEDARSLLEKLVRHGVRALGECLRQLQAGIRTALPQTGAPSAAPALSKERCRIDFRRPAREVFNQVRALALGPQAFAFWSPSQKKPLRVQFFKAAVWEMPPAQRGSAQPGEVLRIESGRGFVVKCLEGSLLVLSVRPEGGKAMPAWDFANGRRLKPGDLFN
ncbi:MAG: methionyl-tRNA formyltransferase [Elusimicrobia bacterium]|nr:methionyl-tRNA formyltransferase [Elusimicrobiota bacterium]